MKYTALLTSLWLTCSASAAAQDSAGCQPVGSTKCAADMARVNAALVSAESFWKFLTSPETRYFDREAAVEKGAKLMSAEWIPRLARARGELLKEWNLHQFGVALSRWDAGGGRFPHDPRSRIGTNIKRRILGHEFIVPETRLDYPETSADRALAPWPFQVFYLVVGLYGSSSLYDRVVSNSDAAAIDGIVLGLPCDDYESALTLVKLTLKIAEAQRRVRPEIFGTWLNALHNLNGAPVVERATLGIMADAAKFIRPAQADDSWAMLQVLGLEELRTNDTTHAYPAMDGIRYIRPIPNTLVLAAARYLAEREGNAFSHAVNANVLLEAIGQPAIAPPEKLRDYDERKKADYEALLVSFREWLSHNEAAYEEKARAESGLIAGAREKLRGLGACKP